MLANNTNKQRMVQAMLENQFNHFEERPSLYGPYYCDQDGEYISVDEAADPEYEPCIAFYLVKEPEGALAKVITRYVYYPQTDVYYRVTTTDAALPHGLGDEGTITIIDVKKIDDWVIKEIFIREPKIYEPETDPLGPFVKFAFPLIRKSFPKLMSTDLVSVQPMTQSSSLVFYIKNRYGAAKGNVGSTKGTV